MPKIVINEQEAASLATFDVTENTALVPILYARSYKDGKYEDIIDSKLYINAKDFKADYASKHIWMDADRKVPDRSYIMIYELLLQGLNVVVKNIKFENADPKYGDDPARPILSEEEAQALLEKAVVTDKCLDEFKNKNIYNIKFITSGAYPNCGLIGEGSEAYSSSMHTTLAKLAEERGDAVAIIDFRKELAALTKDEILAELKNINANSFDKNSNAMFPWCNFNTSVMEIERQFVMPSGFAYLMDYANSVKTNANWFAAAGVIRGAIPNMIAPLFDVGEDMMHILQGDEGDLSIAVNPIYNAGTYGYRIWGNKVMKKNDSVTDNMFMDYLNVRILLCDIKKQIYHAAMRTTFEPNDDIVWINFKTLANSLLDKMKSGRGIKWYAWTKEVADAKATIKATLTIRPIEAVDNFILTVNLSDQDASIEEANV